MTNLAALALAWLILDGQLHCPVWVLLWGSAWVGVKVVMG